MKLEVKWTMDYMNSIVRFCLIGFLITGLFAVSGCIKPATEIKQITNASPPIPQTTPILSMPVENTTSFDNNWIYEGAIYETHPDYYPNHSFKEIAQSIPQLSDLGVKTLYIMPIWEWYLYDIDDYYKIKTEDGTDNELKEIVNTAHRYKMKVLFDLVTCCTHEGSVVWNNDWILNISQSDLNTFGLKLDYETKNDSKYVYSSNCIDYNHPVNGKQKSCYLAGKLVDNKVKLFHYPHTSWKYAIDRTNPEAIKYFSDVAAYYVREYDIDGWRIDAPGDNYNPKIIPGDHSDLKLLRSVRKAILEVKPDAVLVSEGASTVPSIQYDINKVMPYPVFDEIADASYSYYFDDEFKYLNTSEQIVEFFRTEKILHNRTRLRHIETHDTLRINKEFPNTNRALMVLISTVPGIPMIQTGQEIGATNPFNPSPAVVQAHGDRVMRDFYKKVFEIRNSHPALKYGGKDSISNIYKSGDNIYAYSRTFKNENVFIVLNFLDKSATSILDLKFLEKGTVLHDELNNEDFVVQEPDNFKITVKPFGSRILTKKY